MFASEVELDIPSNNTINKIPLKIPLIKSQEKQE